MIDRAHHLQRLETLLQRNPVVGLIGPRQVGKTTLARAVAAGGPATFFDLEDPRDVARLADPPLALEALRGLVVIDEIQRMPELFGFLRVLADRQGAPARFLVLGSASPDLLRRSADTLAGRIGWLDLPGFGLQEVEVASMERLWLRGGFPRSFLAIDDEASMDWRRGFVRSFLESDLTRLGLDLPMLTASRFWTMLAHWHGQLWNAAEFARSFGVSAPTVSRWLDILAGAFVIRRIAPWYANVGKRLVRSPRVWLADSGLVHTLLDVATPQALLAHPIVGASWEGFAIDTIRQALGAAWEECSFWRTHAGAELDLLVTRGDRRIGFEVKRTSMPSVTSSMRIAFEDLQLESLTVVHAGQARFPLGDRIDALPLSAVPSALASLGS